MTRNRIYRLFSLLLNRIFRAECALLNRSAEEESSQGKAKLASFHYECGSKHSGQPIWRLAALMAARAIDFLCVCFHRLPQYREVLGFSQHPLDHFAPWQGGQGISLDRQVRVCKGWLLPLSHSRPQLPQTLSTAGYPKELEESPPGSSIHPALPQEYAVWTLLGKPVWLTAEIHHQHAFHAP